MPIMKTSWDCVISEEIFTLVSLMTVSWLTLSCLEMSLFTDLIPHLLITWSQTQMINNIQRIEILDLTLELLNFDWNLNSLWIFENQTPLRMLDIVSWSSVLSEMRNNSQLLSMMMMLEVSCLLPPEIVLNNIQKMIMIMIQILLWVTLIWDLSTGSLQNYL